MTTTRTTTAPALATTRMRVGLVLTILIGLANLPFLLMPTAAGETGPPYAVIVAGAIAALVSIGAALYAWRSGHRTAVRIAAACVIVNAVLSLPAFFVDVPAADKVGVAITVLLSVLAVVLMLSPKRPAEV